MNIFWFVPTAVLLVLLLHPVQKSHCDHILEGQPNVCAQR